MVRDTFTLILLAMLMVLTTWDPAGALAAAGG